MAAGKKTGGRKRGTPNKRTADLIERLERLKCDPIEALARIAKGAEKAGDLDLARRCHADLMPYRYARQKPVDAPVSIDLPVPASSAEALSGLAVLIEAVSRGDLTPDQAGRLVALYEAHRRTYETEELEARISRLEGTAS